ncbi:hypothetical protein OE88DRAFT_526372 [Heliocybe sulcata]|uniref:Uncharacterized protein n=1 Tax=Heliocybe sulcata TaxID=5364 RepID=A0A5C3MSU9_9AGAM|nr:hypothetical protein OE88DRAFT_526372 [Heliocybe sulcata]
MDSARLPILVSRAALCLASGLRSVAGRLTRGRTGSVSWVTGRQRYLYSSRGCLRALRYRVRGLGGRRSKRQRRGRKGQGRKGEKGCEAQSENNHDGVASECMREKEKGREASLSQNKI